MAAITDGAELKARSIGPNTAQLFERILNSKPHPEMGYRSCLGIIRLAEQYSAQRMEAAAERALLAKACRYQSVKSILKNSLDTVPLSPPPPGSPPLTHDNVRGAEYFDQGGSTDSCWKNQHHWMEKLLAMRWQGMVEGLKTQEQDRAIHELSFLERLSLLVDQQWNWRENQALERRLKAAKLRGPACVEDIDYRAARGLDKVSVLCALAKDSDLGAQPRERLRDPDMPCGVGKSFLASALAQKACRDGYSALYLRAAALFRELALARADGSLRHFLARLARIEVLVIDDWAMAPLNESERREVWEICEDRYQTRSTVLTSQLPVSRWHEQIGDPTIADGILDRLVHNAHRIDMRAESPCEKNRNPTLDEKKSHVKLLRTRDQ